MYQHLREYDRYKIHKPDKWFILAIMQNAAFKRSSEQMSMQLKANKFPFILWE